MNYFPKAKWFYASLISIFFIFFFQPNVLQAKTLDIEAESAIIIDANTGKVLFAKNEKEALPPASMTKMMTEYLVWDAVEKGTISWETTTEISDYAYAISANNSFSGVGLRQNVDYTVLSLYEAMAINSDNATTIALTELIAGSEGEFVKLMNEKGKEMGLPDFKFVNSTGLDNKSLDGKHPEGTEEDDTNLLSAESAAILGYYLVTDFPESLDISSVPETEFDGQTIRNWNWMLPHDASFLEPHFYEGVDGLKTGYTDLAGYSFTGTVEKNGQRLITVVMKTKSETERFKETAKLMDYGFSQFETVELFPAGYKLNGESTIPVIKGKEELVEIITKDAFKIPIKKGDEEQYSLTYELDESVLNSDGELVAPIEKDTVIGRAYLTFDGTEDYGYILKGEEKSSVELITTKNIEKKNWFSLMLGAIGQFFVGLYDKIIGIF